MKGLSQIVAQCPCSLQEDTMMAIVVDVKIPNDFVQVDMGRKGSADMPNITNGIREQGSSPSEVAGIMGGNFLRLYEQVLSQPLVSDNRVYGHPIR